MTKPPISLQDLRRSLYVKAKAEPSWRFWGLRRLGACAGVVDVLHRQIELVLVRFPVAAVFGAPIGEHAQQRHIMFLVRLWCK